MITNLLITGEHKIKLGKSQKLAFGDSKVSVKEIPLVRFRPSEITENTVDYFYELKEKFKYSCHILELEVSEYALNVLKVLADKEDFNIVFLFVPVTDKELEVGIQEDVLDLVNKCIDTYDIERLIIKDNTSMMHSIQYNELKSQITNATGGGESKHWIGICGSPMSFGDEACLTAVIAREIMANYGENDEYALPSSKHESMNECGCIRHMVIERDVTSVVEIGKSKNDKTIKGTGNKGNGIKVMRKFGH